MISRPLRVTVFHGSQIQVAFSLFIHLKISAFFCCDVKEYLDYTLSTPSTGILDKILSIYFVHLFLLNHIPLVMEFLLLLYFLSHLMISTASPVVSLKTLMFPSIVHSFLSFTLN